MLLQNASWIVVLGYPLSQNLSIIFLQFCRNSRASEQIPLIRRICPKWNAVFQCSLVFRFVMEVVLCVCGFFENRRMNSSVLDAYGSVEEIYGCVGNFVSEFYRWVLVVKVRNEFFQLTFCTCPYEE